MDEGPKNFEAKNPLEQFRGEIAEWQRKEVSGEVKSNHFLVPGTASREPNPDFNKEELTEEDRAMWENIKNQTVTIESFNTYKKTVDDSGSASRKVFADFAGNKAMQAIYGYDEK